MAKTGLIGLYSGRKINELAKKKEKITRTQTALNAQKQIIKKYGKVVESAKYLHKGKGNWVKYSLANDRKRTGKTTTDLKAWRRQPNKLDYKGIDTKGSQGKSGIAKKKVVKKKSTSKFAISQLKSPSKPKGRTAKKTIPAHKPTLKTFQKKSNPNVYMRTSPYTSIQKQAYNSYSFYDVDINKEFNNTVKRMDEYVRKKYTDKIPQEVLRAVARYRKAVYESYLDEGRARATAPSMMVVGPAGYKNFDRKIARANAIRDKSTNNVNYAEKQIDLAIKRSNVKKEISAVKKSYGINIGDKIILYWTNNYRQYNAPAKVIKINANTVIGKLLKEINGYPIGHEINVPMIGTKGNHWEHMGKGKPSAPSRKEMMDKYYADNPSPFKVGDKVKHLIYGEGVVTKVNKATMIIKVPPNYKGDDGIRKVSNDTKTNKKL